MSLLIAWIFTLSPAVHFGVKSANQIMISGVKLGAIEFFGSEKAKITFNLILKTFLNLQYITLKKMKNSRNQFRKIMLYSFCINETEKFQICFRFLFG